MASLKVYVDLMSQPCRALTLFLRLNAIPHELSLVQLKKGQHMEESFASNVNRFRRVPGIIDNGRNIIETIAIVRYLSAKYPVQDHWYSKDIQKQAKVDEFLEWHHIGLRLPLSMYFQTIFIRPLLSGVPPKPSHVEMWLSQMTEALDLMENVWLKDNAYLTGDTITFADLIGLCEVDQPRMAGYEPGEGRPRLSAWADRVRSEIQPHYDDVTSVVRMVINKYKGKPPATLSQL